MKNDEIRAILLHLGHNMWCDYMPDDMDNSILATGRDGRGAPDTVLRSKDELWYQAVDRMVATKMNMLVIDLGEGMVFPSHPELSIQGSWSPDKMRQEIARLKALGIEAIPKLNFATSHNGWLKHYRRMVSTPTYYKVCEDLIRDVAEIFDHPRFMHLGCDEESATHQDQGGYLRFLCVRKNELWQHDFLHLVRNVEANGMRAWAWSDFGWYHPEFYEWCPRSVLLSNWFYDESYGGFEITQNDTSDKARLQGFYDLQAKGFEQVPCGTNWAGWKRKQLNISGEDVMGRLVKLCRRDLSADTLKGFMMAPWNSCEDLEHQAVILNSIDLMAKALDE